MTTFDADTFAFARQPLQSARARELIQAFAAARPYRSAAVEELAVGPWEYRRPLRPEDLAFLKFQRPIRLETVSQLPSLASQRLLFCLNEQRLMRFPTGGTEVAAADYRSLFTPEMERIAAEIRPFLTCYAFQFIAQAAPQYDLPPEQAVRKLLDRSASRAAAIYRHAAQTGFVADAVRFVLAQSWLLLPMQQAALRVAEAVGAFDALPASTRPSLDLHPGLQALAAALARQTGVDASGHDHWQFYLATSLARANLLWAFAHSQADAFRLCGACFAAEADWLGFACLLGQSAASLGHDVSSLWAADGTSIAERLSGSIAAAEARYGARAAAEIREGFALGAMMAETAMQDLASQVEWLSQIDSYRSAAALIEERIARERPDIDRDTFVEPRDMCSTTHVHNEHRLVSIESGDMIFWGNPGMRLDLHPGDRILIPLGRLHGSTVTSPECTYHQPIIPEDWVADALGRVNTLRVAS